MVLPVRRVIHSVCSAKRGATSFTHLLLGDKPVHQFPRFRRHIFSGQSVVVGVEGKVFRPRDVVVWRGIMAGCTRMSTKKYGHEK